MDIPVTVRMGDDGPNVLLLQQRLMANNCDPGGLDGMFGPDTLAAVTQFQRAKRLTVDGIVGPQTWSALLAPVTKKPTLRKGSTGPGVVLLQDKLTALGYACGGSDGKFGNQTLAAVLAYQKDNGLYADGIVGPQTWAALMAGQSAGVMVPKSAHFTLAEMEFHDTNLESIWTPEPVIYYPNTQRLFDEFLEPLRDEANKWYAGPGEEVKLYIRSGFRGPAYNAKVGGEAGSQHLTGSAADVFARLHRKDGSFLDRRPNCFQLGEMAWDMFRTGGFGLGANVNLHIDLRSRKTYWWYNGNNWTKWEATQGPAATIIYASRAA
jgi:lysozyme family protein